LLPNDKMMPAFAPGAVRRSFQGSSYRRCLISKYF
jgi:hypothetical protein